MRDTNDSINPFLTFPGKYIQNDLPEIRSFNAGE